MTKLVKTPHPLAYLATRVSDATLRANLIADAKSSRGTLAPASERALRGDVLRFSRWCADAGCRDLPASADTVAAFVDAMSDAGKAPASIRRAVSSISTFHRAAQAENPATTKIVTDALKRLHRERGRAQRQAAPITDDLVVRMLEASAEPRVQPRSRGRVRARPGLGGLRDRALLATAYATLARRGELVALLAEDLHTDADGWGTIAIHRSKTDQQGEGAVAGIAPDAMAHLQVWLSAAGITHGPVFRNVDRHGRVGTALEAGSVSRIFKAMALAAGLKAKGATDFSGHSTRVGGAQDLIRFKADMAGAMAVGRWKSTAMLTRYTKGVSARLGAAATVAGARKQFA